MGSTKEKNWKKEIARDTMVLGGLPFYFIVVVRAVIGQFPPFIYQLLIGLAILLVLSWIIKDSNQYIARALVLVVFTSLFYKELFFAVFAFLLWVMMILSLFYLKVKASEISKGILFGIVSSIASYYLTPLFLLSV